MSNRYQKVGSDRRKQRQVWKGVNKTESPDSDSKEARTGTTKQLTPASFEQCAVKAMARESPKVTGFLGEDETSDQTRLDCNRFIVSLSAASLQIDDLLC